MKTIAFLFSHCKKPFLIFLFRNKKKNKIVASMAFVLEADDKESLPENVLCSVELNNDNFDGNIPFFP